MATTTAKNGVVKFYRGSQALYSAATHKDGIYFATDTKTIWVNGVQYGIPAGKDTNVWDSIITKVEYAQGSTTAAPKLTVTKLSIDASGNIKKTPEELPLFYVAAGDKSVNVTFDTDHYNISVNPATGGGLKTGADGLGLDISMGLDSATHTIKITDNTGTKELATLDATAFVKDSFLSGATLEDKDASNNTGKYLKFVFKTVAQDSNGALTDDSTQTIYLNVRDLFNNYTAGNGIDISGTGDSPSISIKRATSTLDAADAVKKYNKGTATSDDTTLADHNYITIGVDGLSEKGLDKKVNQIDSSLNQIDDRIANLATSTDSKFDETIKGLDGIADAPASESVLTKVVEVDGKIIAVNNAADATEASKSTKVSDLTLAEVTASAEANAGKEIAVKDSLKDAFGKVNSTLSWWDVSESA